MEAALWLLFIQGIFGAFDTVYYHEMKAKLPSLGARAKDELVLHAIRDFIYAILFGTLPWIAWNGCLVFPLVGLFAAEIFITCKDFVVEDRVRQQIGGVYPGERVTHALLGIVYGAMIANMVPVLVSWYQNSTGFAPTSCAVPDIVRIGLSLMAVGVSVSGIRDLIAARTP